MQGKLRCQICGECSARLAPDEEPGRCPGLLPDSRFTWGEKAGCRTGALSLEAQPATAGYRGVGGGGPYREHVGMMAEGGSFAKLGNLGLLRKN